MISIFALKSGNLIRNVASLDGESMKGRGSVPCPADFEQKRWDKTKRAWISCPVAEASYRERVTDDPYRSDNGRDSIKQAHRRLAVEANLWAAFGNEAACPMIIAEAKMRKVSVADLAETIRKHDAEWITREVARKRSKLNEVKNG